MHDYIYVENLSVYPHIRCLDSKPEAEFLDVIGTKVLRVFLFTELFTVTPINGFTTPSLSKSGLKLVRNVKIFIRKPQV
jgi:hypothetical protein